MPRKPAIHRAKRDIETLFEEAETRVFGRNDLASVLEAHRAQWKLPQRMTTPGFQDFLLRESKLHEVTLVSEDYADVTRFVWDDASLFEIALSIRPDAYFSHGTAVYLHGLTDELPKTIYVNKEQSPKPSPEGTITQERLDAAFRRSPRTSSYVLTLEDFRVVLLAGKHTGRLEVGVIEGPRGERLEATKLERTLIDITVRPVYAGGPHQSCCRQLFAGHRALLI